MSIVRGIEHLVYGLETADAYTLNIGGAKSSLAAAKQTNDSLGVVQHTTELAKGTVDGTSYAAMGVQKGTAFASMVSSNVDPNVVHFVKGTTMTSIMGGIGLLGSILGIIIETLSIVRQEETIQATQDAPHQQITSEDAVKLKEALSKLQGLKFNRFMHSLPTYMKQYVQEMGGEKYLQQLSEEIDQDMIGRASNFVFDVRMGALKKQFVHILGLITFVLGLVTSIMILAGCPLLAITILSLIGLAFTVMTVLLRKGWVENPKDEFNWKLCFPQFLQKKLRVDKDIEVELNADSFTQKQGQIVGTVYDYRLGKIEDYDLGRIDQYDPDTVKAIKALQSPPDKTILLPDAVKESEDEFEMSAKFFSSSIDSPEEQRKLEISDMLEKTKGEKTGIRGTRQWDRWEAAGREPKLPTTLF